MATLTIELPDELMQQVERRGISQHEPEWTDGEAFARRMIANNRELFEELARL